MAKTPPFFMPGTVEKWQNPRLCLAQIGPRLGLPKARASASRHGAGRGPSSYVFWFIPLLQLS